MKSITKFLRYPGSKRRMLSFLMQHLPEEKDIERKYVEAFVGSGSVFFSINPRNAVLSDINPDLIDLFTGIQIDPSGVWKEYCAYGNTREDFSQARKNKRETIQERAARILFLNRTCFKGMWRTNKNGVFNVGYGGQDRRWVIREENLLEVSNILKNAAIFCSDFEVIIDQCQKGDFLFLDPPYRPGSFQEKNDHYTGKNFLFEDQIRLADSLKNASRKNINWAMTNSSHSKILNLYKGFYHALLPMGTGEMPGKLVSDPGEMLVTNYPIKGGTPIV